MGHGLLHGVERTAGSESCYGPWNFYSARSELVGRIVATLFGMQEEHGFGS